jgi:hypothetical protein
MSTDLKHPSSDKVIDDKIRRLIDQASRIRKNYQFIDKPAGNARRDDLPLPRGFKPRHAGKSETGEQK